MKTFFRLSLIFLAAIIHFSSIAQPLDGKLFIDGMTQSGGPDHGLSVVSYPSGAYDALDTFTVVDMAAHKGILYAAQRTKYGLDQTHIVGYNIQSLQLIDSLQISNVGQLGLWDDLILVGSLQPPYLKAYDINNHQLIWQVDTITLNHKPSDMIVIGDTLWMIALQHLIGFDLQAQQIIHNQNTAAVLSYPSNPYFNENLALSAFGKNLYIGVEFATGATRSAMLAFDTQTLTLTQAYHAEGPTLYYCRPIAIEDRVYVYGHPTYYDVPQDSLYYITAGGFYQRRAVAHDFHTETFMVSSAYDDTLSYWQQGVKISDQALPCHIQDALYVRNSSNVIIQPEFNFEIMPNPAHRLVRVRCQQKLEEIRLLDLQGKLVQRWEADPTLKEHELELDQPATGLYLLELRAGELLSSEKLYIR